MKDYINGLAMLDGREINMRPHSEMGLCKMARLRKEMKRAEKVRMMAEANEMANANINLFKKF